MTSLTLFMMLLRGSPNRNHCSSYSQAVLFQRVENRNWTIEILMYEQKCIPPISSEEFLLSGSPEASKLEYSLYQSFVPGRGNGTHLMKHLSHQMPVWKANKLRAFIIDQCKSGSTGKNRVEGLECVATLRQNGKVQRYDVRDLKSMSRIRLRLRNHGCPGGFT